jgi:hypothetical protein
MTVTLDFARMMARPQRGVAAASEDGLRDEVVAIIERIAKANSQLARLAEQVASLPAHHRQGLGPRRRK